MAGHIIQLGVGACVFVASNLKLGNLHNEQIELKQCQNVEYFIFAFRFCGILIMPAYSETCAANKLCDERDKVCTTPYSAINKLLFARLNQNEEQKKMWRESSPKTRLIYPKSDFSLQEFFSLTHMPARSLFLSIFAPLFCSSCEFVSVFTVCAV